MQGRMKQHQLSSEQIDNVLTKAKVGHIGTLNADGYPYVLPVHFVHADNKILIHGLNRGQKIENIKANSKVCLEVADMKGFIMDEKACDVNTEYESVVILGNAKMLETNEEKIAALDKIVAKYTPSLSGQQFPDNMLKMTGIIEISIETITGKFYK